MGNTIQVEQKLAALALARLREKIIFIDNVERGYEKEFGHRQGDTLNIRNRGRRTAKAFTGSGASSTDITESAVSLVLNHYDYDQVQLTGKEATLSVEDYFEQVIAPMIDGLAERVNKNIAASLIENGTGTASVSGTPVIGDIAKVAKELDLGLAPQNDRYIVFGSTHYYDDYLPLNAFSYVAYAGDNEALREANIGKVYGMRALNTQAVPDGKLATNGTSTGMKVAGSAGATTVTLSNLGNAKTVKKGEGFIWKDVLYTFTADVTADASGDGTGTISPALATDVAATDTVVVIRKSYSVAYQKNAVLFACVPLANPEGGAKAETIAADGLSIQLVWGYDFGTKSNIVSANVLYGIKVARPDQVVVLS